MKNILSKVSVLSAIGLMSSGIAFASTSENSHTGADSTNNNQVDSNQTTDQNIDNSADIENVGEASADTGNNDSNRNTGGGVVDSGNADIEGSLENMVNTLEAYLSGNFGDVDWDLLNHITGSNSDNRNNLDANQTLNLDLTNDAELTNVLSLLSSSGSNDANANTGGGEVETGNAMAGADITNELNLGSGYEGHFGDVHVSASNDTTGADSTNRNRIDANQEANVDVNNTSNVTNVVASSASTGGNDSNRNTGGGSVDTGSAEASAKITNKVNQGASASGAEFGDVHVDASNKVTGADSTNRNNVDVNQTSNVDVNNEANVVNTSTQDASTGGNDANRNTGGGEVSTGDAHVSIDISNTVN